MYFSTIFEIGISVYHKMCGESYDSPLKVGTILIRSEDNNSTINNFIIVLGKRPKVFADIGTGENFFYTILVNASLEF